VKKKRNLSETAKLSGGSLDIKAGQVEKLKSLFPQTVKDGEIDFDALKLALGGETDTNGLSYGLSWAGKADCFRHIQEGTTATLKPIRGESVDFDHTKNIFIEGDNLEVLKVLQKNYYGKVKMIYIDPPYNTGNDSFIYPDRFKEEKADYQERAGIKDAEGLLTRDGFFRKNSKDTGHFHSNWLCMMYPRLFLAKNLLRQDGVIFVSIDDNEVHNLRMIMNEVFGEENFVAIFPWRKRTAKSDVPFGISQDYEYILCFCRENFQAGIQFERKYFETSDYPNDRWRLSDLTTQRSAVERPNSNFTMIDPKTNKKYPCNSKRVWGVSKDTFPDYYQKGKIVFPGDYSFLKMTIPAYRVFESEDKAKALKKFGSEENVKAVSTQLPKEVGMSEDGNKEMVNLFSYKAFSFPKPATLISYLINLINDENSIILDFFAGSCTTAHAVMALNAEDGGNRKYICVQLAEPCDEKSEAYKAGFKTIADIGKERIRRAGKKIKAENKGKLDFDGGKLDLGFKVFRLDESNFKQWRENIKTGEELKEQMKMFVDNKKKGSAPEAMLYEIILKNSRFDLNAPIEKMTFDGIEYYRLATEDTEVAEKKNTDFEIVCLAEKITRKLAEKILKEKPQKFTCLDTAFKNNDQLKTNTALQMDAEKIEFKVV